MSNEIKESTNKSEKIILGIDIGFGDCKICVGSGDGKIIKKFKFPSSVGVTKKLDGVVNNRIMKYNDNYYMVGDDAKHLPSENIIDIDSYKNLEYFAPLLLEYAVRRAEIENPDVVVTGLSIAQINNSAYFQEILAKYTVDDIEKHNKVYLLPQGAGAKLAYDVYGGTFPEKQKDFLGEATYCIIDIGFNTLDLVLVDRGLTDPNLFHGIEKHGLYKIAVQVSQFIHEKHSRQLSLQEAKDILNTGAYVLRNQKYDYSVEIKKLKEDYLREILKLIEDKYGKILDKLNFVVIAGGGSNLFSESDDSFIRILKNDSEYYNSIGEYLYGVNQL